MPFFNRQTILIAVAAINGLLLLAGEALTRGATIVGNEIYASSDALSVTTGHRYDIRPAETLQGMPS